jgi:hypothetical protein
MIEIENISKQFGKLKALDKRIKSEINQRGKQKLIV